jgi:hypothetical protein
LRAEATLPEPGIRPGPFPVGSQLAKINFKPASLLTYEDFARP